MLKKQTYKSNKFFGMFSLFKLINILLRGNSKYFIRLDDACETMNMEKWKKIESILDDLKIQPIVAVIPNNKDVELFIENKNKNFWDLVYSWQEKGWHIALHGYEHKYHKINRHKQFMPLHDRSEFVSLNKEKQDEKIKKGINIFKRKKIKTNIWVAPSHSFDEITINSIKKNTNIKIISDGIALYPIRKDGLIFLPQQLWSPFKFPFGIWTICLHPNNMSYNEIDKFKEQINNDFYKNKFISLCSIKKYINNNNFFSFVFDKYFRFKIFAKYLLKN